MSDISNYHVIRTQAELPSNGPNISAISLGVKDERAAQEFAQKHPESQIYWIIYSQYAVSITPAKTQPDESNIPAMQRTLMHALEWHLQKEKAQGVTA